LKIKPGSVVSAKNWFAMHFSQGQSCHCYIFAKIVVTAPVKGAGNCWVGFLLQRQWLVTGRVLKGSKRADLLRLGLRVMKTEFERRNKKKHIIV